MKFALIRFIFFITSLLPITVTQTLGVVIGNLLYFIPNRQRFVAKVNIKVCFPDLSDQEQNRLVQKTLIENAKLLLETPHIFRIKSKKSAKLVVSSDNVELFNQAIQKGSGVILAVPHLGNWEVGIHYLCQHNEITVMYAPHKNQWIDNIILEARKKSGANLVPTNVSGVKSLLKTLKKGGIVVILPDQRPKRGNASIYAPFFNHQANTMLLVNKLAQKTGANVLMGINKRLSIGKGFHIQFFETSDEIASTNPYQAAITLNSAIEKCILLAPAQYQWVYRRFSKPAVGEISPYHQYKDLK